MASERPLLDLGFEYRPAVPATLEAIHFECEQFCNLAKAKLPTSVPDRWKLEFDTALLEICANIIKHAFADSPQQGTMELHLRLYSNRVEVEITDDGAYFDEEASRAETSPGPDTDLLESGRGLKVARALLDTLRYRRGQESTNNWLLVKMLP